jgi:regulatory protein
MIISKIEQQVKTKDRYSVFVDGKFSFGISELGLINSGLKVGQELSAEELEGLKVDAKSDKIFNQVLALIMRRPRSQWEIENYLKQKGIDQDMASGVISRLTDKGYIDDLDFARRWVDNRRLLKNISKRKLELELRQKRVDGDIVKRVMGEDKVSELEVLKQEIIKKRQQSRYKDETKMMQYLARQGYGYGDIKQALADLSNEAG